MVSEKIALFPLDLVAFPGQPLSLHIFEPRYQELIRDCMAAKMTFGIPAYLDGKLQEYGTEVRLMEVVNQYEDGRMDIITEGARVFKLQTFENPMGAKLYAGGEVFFREDEEDNASSSDRILLLEQAQKLFEVMQVELSIDMEQPFLSYQLGNKVGLAKLQEYYLLTLEDEKSRIEVLKDHITRNLPVIAESERSKARIRMNGHFKNMDPLNF